MTDIDVIKLHIRSGKVSLMGYDDFSKPIPYLVERVKIKMAEQEVDFFDYINEQTRPPNIWIGPPRKRWPFLSSFQAS
ncbi:hypothetical protein [Aeromonas salmonicida]|uniref:hypothetical protein n=1 Tax=Aeromonas salmonicida TaxID=645 RepID=UPI00330CC5F4|nr:hypothetical protein [Aeromonas salmonicida]